MSSNEVALPTTGELVDLGNAAQCAAALHEVEEAIEKLKELKRMLTPAVLDESARLGSKTLMIGGMRVVVKGGDVIHWDVEVLDELLDAGLPQERFDELVKVEVTHKVLKREADRIAAGKPEYAEIIARAQTPIPRSSYVTVEPDPYA